MNWFTINLILLQVLCLCSLVACRTASRPRMNHRNRLSTKISQFTQKEEGTRWALLIAGSRGYLNYRHQADVCHAYQLLKKGGLKDENIVVFMYDDIVNATDNPRKGEIINRPNGQDVYKGVPKDYTDSAVNVENFYAAILGNKSAITRGTGKVLNSGPNDHVLIYYADHGADGCLGMPTFPYVYGNDLVNVLKLKHARKGFKSLVFYLEACESASVFDGLLPEGLNIFATTAANASESSWAAYCPGDKSDPAPDDFYTCLGDLYSVSWLEDAEIEDRQRETLEQEYELIKNRTMVNENEPGSHVLEFGDSKKLGRDHVSEFMGVTGKLTSVQKSNTFHRSSSNRLVSQRDADLLHFWSKFFSAHDGSKERLQAQEDLVEYLSHRVHIDSSFERIGQLLFKSENSQQLMNAVRAAGKPAVDDWDCLKLMVRTFETHCGSLSQYGMKHMRSLASMCNAKINPEQLAGAAKQTCPSLPANKWSSLDAGFSA